MLSRAARRLVASRVDAGRAEVNRDVRILEEVANRDVRIPEEAMGSPDAQILEEAIRVNRLRVRIQAEGGTTVRNLEGQGQGKGRQIVRDRVDRRSGEDRRQIAPRITSGQTTAPICTAIMGGALPG